MICKNYTVTGEDVNDFMVMENTAYISYTLRLLYHFLFTSGFSKEKLNALHLGFQEQKTMLVLHKDLMFTESFTVKIKYCRIDDTINIESSFYNSKEECCAEVTNEIKWFDTMRNEIIVTPSHILKHFRSNL
nr:hypothetical protein [uncultured Flavobacterium sp.]